MSKLIQKIKDVDKIMDDYVYIDKITNFDKIMDESAYLDKIKKVREDNGLVCLPRQDTFCSQDNFFFFFQASCFKINKI